MCDATTCVDLYRQAEAILVRDVPILPLTYARWYAPVKPRVTSFPISAMRCWFLKDAVVAQDLQRRLTLARCNQYEGMIGCRPGLQKCVQGNNGCGCFLHGIVDHDCVFSDIRYDDCVNHCILPMW